MCVWVCEVSGDTAGIASAARDKLSRVTRSKLVFTRDSMPITIQLRVYSNIIYRGKVGFGVPLPFSHTILF